jgi:hypothetical protein
MTPAVYLATGIAPAFGLLQEPRLDTPNARALVLAIALQETGLSERRQFGSGPARSYAQFERGGISGVLSHVASARLAHNICDHLDVNPTVDDVYQAIEFNDVLCAAFTRLNLLTSPIVLPARTDSDTGWRLYQTVWRPGAPHPEKWSTYYELSWGVVDTFSRIQQTLKA